MRTRQRGLAALVVLIVTAGVVINGVPAAWAVLPACNAINHLFVRNTALPAVTHGTTNEIKTVNRDLDPNCQAATFSTAHYSKGTFGTQGAYSYLEIGWTKQYDPNGPGTVLCVFWERRTDDVPDGQGFACFTPLSYGTFSRYRIVLTSPAPTYDLKVNYGGSWDTKKTWSTSYDSGLASGETEQFGSQTGMSETQQDEHYYAHNAWQSWTGVACAVDEAPNWDWHRQSDTSYTVSQISNPC